MCRDRNIVVPDTLKAMVAKKDILIGSHGTAVPNLNELSTPSSDRIRVSPKITHSDTSHHTADYQDHLNMAREGSTQHCQPTKPPRNMQVSDTGSGP